jgi:hypothetical protein
MRMIVQFSAHSVQPTVFHTALVKPGNSLRAWLLAVEHTDSAAAAAAAVAVFLHAWLMLHHATTSVQMGKEEQEEMRRKAK